MVSRRVAFVSDIHGNLPAFSAVLEELERRGPFDAIVGGGDFAAAGLYPTECVERLRSLGWPCVRGNTEEWVVEAATDGRMPARDVPEEMQARGPALRAVDRWCAERLSDDAIQYLGQLPLCWQMDGPSGQRLVFVHATPSSPHPVIAPDATDELMEHVLEDADAQVLLYGHIHFAYLRQVGDKTIGCIGAVGMPMDGDPRPCWAIAEDNGAGWRVEHVRVEYDRDGYLANLAASDFPNAGAHAAAIRAAGAS
jgi:predicted phosphodiesterase